jgi:hypothetical protein
MVGGITVDLIENQEFLDSSTGGWHNRGSYGLGST